ncbi:uncharacterized protein LOC142223095 [Haematobia irritans]|uniref:uncharacterized protein LOC142223095 n=1 Tax=Haematobia irritans TaxID=7368 RepID=UPI003F505E7D
MTDSSSPVNKIKRVSIVNNMENQIPPEIQTNILLKKIGQLTESTHNMQTQLNVIQGQLRVIVETLAENKAVTNKLVKQHNNDVSIQQLFPIKNVESVIKVNEEINENNKAAYVAAISAILQPARVLKNLRYIIGDDVTMAFNIEGVHGKKSLKSMENFYGVLLEAISGLTNNCRPPEDRHRKALQRQKKTIQ